jgi:hypothetical protein
MKGTTARLQFDPSVAAFGVRISASYLATYRVTYLAIFLLLLSLLTAGPAFALPDELEVHLDETTPKGEFGFDMVSNYTFAGPRRLSDETEKLRSSVHLLQISPSLSYGIASNTQIGLQLFSSIGPGGETRVDGGRVELISVPIRPDDDDDDGFFLGGLLEVGHLPRTLSANRLDAEIKMIVGYRTGRWTFASNPEVGFKVAGDGSSLPEFSIKLKTAYRINQTTSIGLEHFGDLGELHHLGHLNQQSQQTFAVVDLKAGEMEFNLGLGRGWTDVSERWVLKTIVSFPFGK